MPNAIVYHISSNMTNMLDKGISSIAYNFLYLPKTITATQGNTSYVYRADGGKVKKTFGSKTVDYLNGFQYQNQVLQFLPTAEGYYDFAHSRYVYQYKDQVGNVRVSYFKNGSVPKVDKESNYYPFGLEHSGYNQITSQQPNYQYSFQGQEKQDETGWLSFKCRNYDPSIGRFFNHDPLSEKYAYNSPYAFSENRVIDGRELEGLEWVSTKIYSLDGSTTIYQHADIKVNNNSSGMSASDAKSQAINIAKNTEGIFTGRDSNGNYVSTSVAIIPGKTEHGKSYYLDFVDVVEGGSGASTVGKVDTIGNTQVNRIQIRSGLTDDQTSETGSHEIGHTTGLRHETDSSNPKTILDSMGANNIMNAADFGNNQSTPPQLSEMQNSIPTTVKIEIERGVYVQPFFNP